MRFAVLATCLVAGVVFADTEINVKPIRMELDAAAAADDADAVSDTSSSSATRAQDYNSSRSNTTSLREGNDLVLRKRPGRKTYANDRNGPKPSGPRAAPAQDYNSSRSNNSSVQPDDSHEDSDSDLMYDRCERAAADGADDDCDDARGAAAPANHNTTRSNRTVN